MSASASVEALPPGLTTTGRLEAFSDGVLAIAITLLVIEVKVPEAPAGGLAEALRHQWPSYLAYAMSFLTIGIMWVNHHAVFDRVRYVDRALLFVNLVLLGAVAFLPFPTAVLAEYLREGEDISTAVGLYAATMVVVGAAFVAVWLHLARHPALLDEGTGPEAVARAQRRSLVGVGSYAVALVLSPVAPVMGLVIFVAVALWFVRPVGPGLRPAGASGR